jgi:hypothetical protein
MYSFDKEYRPSEDSFAKGLVCEQFEVYIAAQDIDGLLFYWVGLFCEKWVGQASR